MTFSFPQQLVTLNYSDLKQLIGIRENDGLEFKQTLPTKGDKQDPWFTNQQEIGSRAKRELAAEVIAFANTSGGILILGISEDQNKCATELYNMPKCHDLADRLGQSIYAMIEPPLTAFECVGIDDKDGAGLVLMRVGASGAAPHRDIENRDAFRRVGDRCQRMTMREIQEMSLDRWRAAEEIQRVLKSRKLVFHENVSFDRNFGNKPPDVISLWAAGWRGTAVPIEQIFRKDIATWQAFRLPDPAITFMTHGSGLQSVNPELMHWRPMLRGLLNMERNNYHPQWERRSLEANGLIEITESIAEKIAPGGQRQLHAFSVLRSFARLLILTDAFRKIIDRPRMGVAFEFEWIVPTQLNMIIPGGHGFAQTLKFHQPKNHLKDISLTSDMVLDDIWAEVQREFFQSCGLEMGNIYPVDFAAGVKSVLDRVLH